MLDPFHCFPCIVEYVSYDFALILFEDCIVVSIYFVDYFTATKQLGGDTV